MIINKNKYNFEVSPSKHVLYNLSELLTNKPIASPDMTLSMRLFPNQRYLQQNQKTKRNNIVKKQNSRINFQLFRTKSSFQFRNRVSINVEQQNIDKIVKLRKNTLKLKQLQKPTIQGISLEKPHRSQQLFSNSLLKSRNFAFKQYSSVEKINSSKKDEKQFVTNHALKKKQSLQSLTTNPEQKNYSHRQKFLKKGSSLQKQIVTNILRNKLIKQQQQQRDNYEHIDNQQDIIKMIKLYKGFNDQTKKKSPKQTIQEDQQSQSANLNGENADMMNLMKGQKRNQIQNSSGNAGRTILGWQIQNDLDIGPNDQYTQQISIEKTENDSHRLD